MDIQEMVLRENGFRAGQPRKDGSRVIKRDAMALSAGVTFRLTITAPAEGNPTLVVAKVTREDGKEVLAEVINRTDTWSEIASDAVALAFKISQR